jgi:MGT family glycosyltransferase
MARFLISCWPFPGHVFQPLAIARVLRERGHECAFYTGNRAARTVQDQGFPFFPFRKVDEDGLYNFLFSPEQTRSVKGLDILKYTSTLQTLLLETIPPQIEDLEAIISEWRPDVLATDPNVLGPVLILREKLDIPVAILSYFSCTIPGPDAPPFGLGLPRPRNWYTRLLSNAAYFAARPIRARFRRAANKLRHNYGLPPLQTNVMEYCGTMPLYMVMGTAEFDYERRDLPPSVRYVGACLWDKPGHERSSDWLDQLPSNQPWVHATEGTLHVQEPFVLRAAAQGLADLPMQVILSTGGNREPSQLNLGPIAKNVHLVRWVSHTDLLPRLDLMITTGGSATVQATLRAGVPLIIIPTEWDKPDIARRVMETGAGLRLWPKQCTPEKLRAAVQQVLTTPSFRHNAQRMAAAFARYGGPPAAAELLEGLAAVKPAAPVDY